MKNLPKVVLTGVLLALGLGVSGREKAKDNSLLWRISNKDMKKPSYLFGTMHMICPEDYVWTDAMKNSLQKAEAVCFEMDLDAPDMFMEIAKGMMNHSGKRLKDYFSEEDYAKIAKYLSDTMGVDIAMFEQMKPAAIQSLITEKTFNCSSPVSYEVNIMQEAQRDKKEILGLETPAEQLDLFDNLPVDSVISELLTMVQGKKEHTEEYTELITAYKTQDLPRLNNLIQKSGSKDIDLGGFLDTRNEKWVPRMVEQMDQRSIFFAVGAGHLWGDSGLITLLRKAGYKVEPVK
jgi:uncharacterized protein YbaP (TraB family)